MASFELTGNSGWSIQITYSESYKVDTNTSSVKITGVKFKNTNFGGYASYLNGYISIGGTKVVTMNSKTPTHKIASVSSGTWTSIVTTEYGKALPWELSNIEHDTSGNATTTISVNITLYNDTSNYNAKTINASKTITLVTIPRASSITSAGNVTLGNKCSVKWTPNDSSFKYKLYFSLGTWNYTTGFIEPKTTSAYTYTGYEIPKNETLLTLIPNSTTETMSVTLTTYNSSGTKIGSTSAAKKFTVTVPDTVKPTAGTIAFDPYNITTADEKSRNILVKNKNKLKINISDFAAGTGSSIKSYTFSGPGVSTTTTNESVTIGPLSNVGTLTYTVKVTDTRGRTASATNSITCEDYSTPSLTSFSAYRCDSNGNAKDDGEHIKYSFGVNYSSVNSTNNVTVKIYYKKSSNNSWSSAANALTTSTTNSASGIIKNSSRANITFTKDTTYMVRAEVTDNYSGMVSSSTITIFGTSKILNIRPNGTGIAFGKKAEDDNLFECKWDSKFNGAVTVPDSGGPVINGYSVGTLGRGTSIDSDSDLNNYITPGVYYSSGSTVSSTLKNTPHTSTGFKLIVEYLGSSSYMKQTIKTRTTACYSYERYYTEGEWKDWKRFDSSDAIKDDIQKEIDKIDLTSVSNLTVGEDQYNKNGKFGINCNNSDIINMNGLYFADKSNDCSEGIHFYNSDTSFDSLYTASGKLKFHANRSSDADLAGNEIYHGGNLVIQRGTCTLSYSSNTTVTFSTAFAGTPTVMITPLTTSSGTIAGKVRSVWETGFEATIGSSIDNVKFAYIAIYTA